MTRRELFLSAIAAAPIGTAGLAVITRARPPFAGHVLELEPGAVKADLRVWSITGGQAFALTLIRTPWPLAGDRIRLRFRDLHLDGIVEHTEATAIDSIGTDRCWYYVSGTALAFSARGPMDV